jgi:hypothetical protein
MRRVFVGSSTESLDKAESICHALSSIEDTQGVLWKEFFEPGYFTFEALEVMLRQCCAAVFIATPDDEAEVRGRKVRCPRANVLLEFGLVAGRLGPHCVAVCRYGGAELPSDLTGLTVIEMGASERELNLPVSKLAKEKLRAWASDLVATIERVPRTDVVHGYTGRWDFTVKFDTWRDLSIVAPSHALVEGAFDLFIPPAGHIGRGLAQGRLYFRVHGRDEDFYQGEFRTAHEITNAVCLKDGRLEFTSRAFAMQKVIATGTAPPQLVGMDFAPEPWSLQWSLCPISEPRSFVGKVTAEDTGVSQGAVKATKLDATW